MPVAADRGPRDGDAEEVAEPVPPFLGALAFSILGSGALWLSVRPLENLLFGRGDSPALVFLLFGGGLALGGVACLGRAFGYMRVIGHMRRKAAAEDEP